jgi:Holliday junction resolvase RusA-like endonuclease
MTEPLSFFVQGHPQTQGGMREVTTKNGGRALITTGSVDLKPWRKKISDTARLAANLAHWETLVDCPVAVTLRFFIPMPKSRPAQARHDRIAYAIKKHDIDKMQRAVLDSLTTAEIYKDDGQVARSRLEKYELVGEQYCGVEVIVWELEVLEINPLLEIRDRREANRASLQVLNLRRR